MCQPRFWSMFPEAPAASFPEGVLEQLADCLQKPENNLSGVDEKAGYTYFSQFLTHDTSHLVNNDGTGTPSPAASVEIDLSHVYGTGFNDTKHSVYAQTGEFVLGRSVDGAGNYHYGEDLPRASRQALIPDQRNDENLVVAQMHLAFLKAHNRLINELKSQHTDPYQAFAEARNILTWHYQETVIYDWLKRFTQQDIWNSYFTALPAVNLWQYPASQPLVMPKEVAFAALRLGHAMPRATYRLKPGDDPVNISELFRFTGLGQLAGGYFLPREKTIDFDAFFGPQAQGFRSIKPKVDLSFPGNEGRNINLALRDLQRGDEACLPSAQELIKAINLRINKVNASYGPVDLISQQALNPAQVADNRILPDDLHKQIIDNTPLYYYLLAEAHDDYLGQTSPPAQSRLGKLGSILLCEFFSLLHQGRTRPSSPVTIPTRGTRTQVADILNYG